VLLGALYVYFARTGQVDEVTFGLPVFNRANGAYKRTAGLFVNQSPVKFCAERDLSFTELLGRISTTLKAVYRHQRLPLSEIRKAVGADVAQTRLFDVGLSYENHDYDAEFAGIITHFTALLHPWEQLPLQLFVRDFHAAADVRLDFVYNQAYFTAVEIRGLQSRFGQVLDSIVGNSDQPIRYVSILPEMERQRLVMEWNATDTFYPQDQCVPQLIEEQVRRTPEATALVFEVKSLSYWELNARANQLAHYLIQLGI
jgi:non-ribosomal peptide synthetase component F